MKKWVFLFVIVALLGYEALQHTRENANGSPGNAEIPVQVSEDASRQRSEGKQGESSKQVTISVAKDQVYKGKLVLVNKKNAVRSEGEQTDIVRLYEHKELIRGFALLDNTIRLSREVAKEFGEMMEAANKDGVNHFMISSGYREEKEQDRLFREMGSDYALPAGYSEHNLGLSLDIGSTQKEMNQAPEGKWLLKEAWKYGFILRYPKDKTAITGIQYEPWHFRYVGMPHSAIMKENNMTLEEYLDYLKEQKTITAHTEGNTYEIRYYPYSKNMKITIPANRRYDITGNNSDGVILTLYL
ncbi:D-alanyl-D-alanine carboxypeptidase family protein [Paenibacillus sp. 32352]|uniref:M15 family metallopeptidase n=1 Tax=Paenibacillus sp. 32352 TaxID=1969111 RepID=UPI0009ACB88F|nr:M15 family metallopeptidase [Paenibacillus sp. 32352]